MIMKSRSPELLTDNIKDFQWGALCFQMRTGEDRGFLAIRQLDDGSFVYFMSLTHVKENDAGEYACEIFTDNLRKLISEAKVNITVEYFPKEDPVCDSSSSTLELQPGVPLDLSCTSEKGSPNVELQWKRTTHGHLETTSISHSNGKIISRMRYVPTAKDDGVVFTCEISSKSFPNTVKKCHLGPFGVAGSSANPDRQLIPSVQSLDYYPTINTQGIVVDQTEDTLQTKLHCKQYCNTWTKQSAFQWIILTIIIGVLAFVFGIIGIILLVKYHSATRTDVQVVERPYGIRQTVPESTYEIPVFTKRDHEVYMPLNKPDLMIEHASIPPIADKHDKINNDV